MPQTPCLSNGKRLFINIRKQYSLKSKKNLCIKMLLVFSSVFKKNVLKILQNCLFRIIDGKSISLSGI